MTGLNSMDAVTRGLGDGRRFVIGDLSMDRSVNIRRCVRTSMFLLNPFGTFRGYGAYVGINPYRVVESDSPDELLGQTILELLSLSGPTGRLFSDANTFLSESRDDETQRVRALFGLDAAGLTTAKLNRRFLMTSVEQKSNQKSWLVQAYLYNLKLRTMSGADTTTLRIKHSEGAHALGVAVRRFMALPNCKQ